MNMTTTIAAITTTLIAIWRMPPVRDGIGRRVKALPAWAQPIPPLVIAALVALGEAYQSGLRGDALLSAVIANGGEAGVLAVGIWHVAKRWFRKPAALAMLTVALLPAVIGCSQRIARSPAQIEAASVVAIKATSAALVKYLEDPKAKPPVPPEVLIVALARAAVIVHSPDRACHAVDYTKLVATSIGCGECLGLIRATGCYSKGSQ